MILWLEKEKSNSCKIFSYTFVYNRGKALIIAEEEIKQSDVISFMPRRYITNGLERINKFMNKIIIPRLKLGIPLRLNTVAGINRPLNPKK